MSDKLKELESQRTRSITFSTLRMHEHVDEIYEAQMEHNSVEAREALDKLGEMVRIMKTDLKKDE